MRKYCLAAILLTAMLSSPNARAEGLALGFADFQKIEAGSTALQAINEHSKALIEGYNKFAKEQDAILPQASPDQRAVIEDLIAERRKRLDIGLNLNDQKFKACEERIRQTIKEVAKEKNLAMVFLQQEVVVLATDFMDITDAVLQRINEDQR